MLLTWDILVLTLRSCHERSCVLLDLVTEQGAPLDDVSGEEMPDHVSQSAGSVPTEFVSTTPTNKLSAASSLSTFAHIKKCVKLRTTSRAREGGLNRENSMLPQHAVSQPECEAFPRLLLLTSLLSQEAQRLRTLVGPLSRLLTATTQVVQFPFIFQFSHHLARNERHGEPVNAQRLLVSRGLGIS